jgi:hypothetical protein
MNEHLTPEPEQATLIHACSDIRQLPQITVSAQDHPPLGITTCIDSGTYLRRDRGSMCGGRGPDKRANVLISKSHLAPIKIEQKWTTADNCMLMFSIHSIQRWHSLILSSDLGRKRVAPLKHSRDTRLKAEMSQLPIQCDEQTASSWEEVGLYRETMNFVQDGEPLSQLQRLRKPGKLKSTFY